MALGDIIGNLLQPFVEKLKVALNPFAKLIDLVRKFFTGFADTFSKVKSLSAKIVSEINAWRNFRESIPVRTGVISLPAAIDKSEQIIAQIKAGWSAIADLAKALREKISSADVGTAADDAKAAIEDIETSGFKTFLSKFPRLAKGLEKILGVVALVVDVLQSIQTAVDDLDAIVGAVSAIREEIETGNTIFLQQKNPRKELKLADGGSIKIRVGNLHR